MYSSNEPLPGPGAAAPASPPGTAPAPPRRLLDQLREQLRYLHYSLRTEQTYVHWVRAFVRWSGLHHPRRMGAAEVQAYLAWLATERQVSVSTHRQALAALRFLYEKVFGLQLPWMQALERPQRKARLPVVLAVAEVRAVLALLDGTHAVLAQRLYGTGMRITEALQRRAKDVEFERGVIVVRCGKGRRRRSSDVPVHIAPAGATSACKREVGGKDRVVMLPATLVPRLREQMHRAHVLWQADARAGRSGVQMPDALERKVPRAGSSWGWFWIFPQAALSLDPRSGVQRRHHLYDQTFQRDFKRAVRSAGIARAATPHTLRHSFATHLLQPGTDFGCGRFASRGLRPHEPAPQRRFACSRTVQKLLGHSDVSTTMICTHMLEVAGGAVRSPLDGLALG